MTDSSPRLTTLPAWKRLQAHYDEISSLHMRELFASQPNRFEEFSITLDSLFLDYSKNRINPKTIQLLIWPGSVASPKQLIACSKAKRSIPQKTGKFFTPL